MPWSFGRPVCLSGVAGYDLLIRKWTTCPPSILLKCQACAAPAVERAHGDPCKPPLWFESHVYAAEKWNSWSMGQQGIFLGHTKIQNYKNQLLLLALKLSSPPWCHKWGPKVPTGKTQLILPVCYINVHLHETLSRICYNCEWYMKGEAQSRQNNNVNFNEQPHFQWTTPFSSLN